MASKTLLFLLGLTIIAVAYGAWEQEETDEDLTYEDLMEYFTPMEKRGAKKVGKCLLPNGSECQLCNLKVKNRNDMRRYIACGSSKSKSRKI